MSAAPRLPPVTARELVLLAAPAAASALLNNAFRVIDQVAAGGVSTAAQAAIGSCTFVLVAAYAVHLAVAGGVGPLAARAEGARDGDLAARVLGVGLSGALATWAGVALVTGLGAERIAAFLGLQGEVAAQAATFLRTIGVLGLPLAVAPTLDAVFVARGRTGVMMALQAGAALGNVVLNQLFLQEWGMGVQGAALATVLSRAPASALGLWWALRPHGVRRPDGETARRVLAVGLPVSVNMLAYATVYFLVLRTAVSPLGPTVNAALGIGFSALEGMAYPCFAGLSMAVGSVVGRRLGAGEPDEARRALRLAFPMTSGLGLAAGLTFWFAAPGLVRPFTHDPEVHAAAVGYARALAWAQPLVAWEALAEGALLGAGASQVVFWFSAPINALRIPLAWGLALGLGWGAPGVWWAINATSLVKAALKGAAAARGGWAGMRV